MNLPPLVSRRSNSVAPVDDAFARAALPPPFAPPVMQNNQEEGSVAIQVMQSQPLQASADGGARSSRSEDATQPRRLSGGGPKLNVKELQDCIGDADGDGDIDEDDRKIQKMLKSIDTDDDGSIDALEMVRVMKKMMEDERKIKNMKRLILTVVIIAMAFVGLSLACTILAIDISKESRNKDGVQVDVRTGDPVKSAALTAGDRMVDASGETIATKRAKTSGTLTSKMRIDDLKLLTDIQLPILGPSGSVDTVWYTVSGFYQASDGSLLELYTPVGAQITVTGEDIYVSQMKPAADAVARRLQVVPASRRRMTMRRRVLETGDYGSSPDAAVTMECGSGNCKDSVSCAITEISDPGTGECGCGDGMEATASGCKCSAPDQYAKWELSSGKHITCTQCPEGSTPTELGIGCECSDSVWDEASNTCSECPAGTDLVQTAWGWACECSGCKVLVRDGLSMLCVACEEGFAAVIGNDGGKTCLPKSTELTAEQGVVAECSDAKTTNSVGTGSGPAQPNAQATVPIVSPPDSAGSADITDELPNPAPAGKEVAKETRDPELETPATETDARPDETLAGGPNAATSAGAGTAATRDNNAAGPSAGIEEATAANTPEGPTDDAPKGGGTGSGLTAAATEASKPLGATDDASATASTADVTREDTLDGTATASVGSDAPLAGASMAEGDDALTTASAADATEDPTPDGNPAASVGNAAAPAGASAAVADGPSTTVSPADVTQDVTPDGAAAAGVNNDAPPAGASVAETDGPSTTASAADATQEGVTSRGAEDDDEAAAGAANSVTMADANVAPAGAAVAKTEGAAAQDASAGATQVAAPGGAADTGVAESAIGGDNTAEIPQEASPASTIDSTPESSAVAANPTTLADILAGRPALATSAPTPAPTSALPSEPPQNEGCSLGSECKEWCGEEGEDDDDGFFALACSMVDGDRPESCGGWKCKSRSRNRAESEDCTCCCPSKGFEEDKDLQCNEDVQSCQDYCRDLDEDFEALACPGDDPYCAGQYCLASREPSSEDGCHCCCFKYD
eukprot:CAMPEP_0117654124 /NCGR_PEP_ID=MMETSP0804-20121206/3571_1 /TAXON_ID=1074897 /ORGANISM="Tetraselmis astigmatica, Strain CCMP880" /LENGTH=1037 /DNA_ID=CAMNT_0005460373 /DNA_START=191 /DNA_END=3304 /DNA_ORIENTATION=-